MPERSPSTPPFHWHSGRDPRWLLLCDHASNRIPARLGDLGLDAAERRRHIAWDIGAADVARRLAQLLRASLIEHRVSRLVIDPNRDLHHPSLVPASSDGTEIPGNRGADAGERLRRWREWHQPYHDRIVRHLDHLAASSIFPFVVSVHSFTPSLGVDNEHRPWPVGLLWRDDPSIAHALIRELARDGTLVGDNQPYDGRGALGYTMERHAVRRGLPHATFELRQDQLATPAGRARWATRLHRALVVVAAAHHPHRQVHARPG